MHKNRGVGGCRLGQKSKTQGQSERASRMGGREQQRERNRHQIHCFHCLIRSTEREMIMAGRGSGGREEEKNEEEREVA